MKTALIALLFAVPAFANDARPYQFETEPGCVWNKNEGRCVVQNRYKDEIKCKVSITGKTLKGLTIGNTRQIVVPAKMFNNEVRVYAADGDEFTHVSATAECKAGA